LAARKEIKEAEKAVAELKEAGGATLVPYEYCSAKSFLEASKFVLQETAGHSQRNLQLVQNQLQKLVWLK
jgi:hypothetical protein